MRTIETKLAGQGMRIGMVVARFNHLITRRLLEGCEGRLRQLGCAETEVMWVPGAFEVPLAVQEAAQSGRYDALVAIAVVVRGETPHFEYVCRGVADGVRQVGFLRTDDGDRRPSVDACGAPRRARNEQGSRGGGSRDRDDQPPRRARGERLTDGKHGSAQNGPRDGASGAVCRGSLG